MHVEYLKTNYQTIVEEGIKKFCVKIYVESIPTAIINNKFRLLAEFVIKPFDFFHERKNEKK